LRGGAACPRPPLIRRVDRQRLIHPFRCRASEDRAHEAFSVERPEIEPPIGPELAGERTPGIAEMHVVRESRAPPECAHVLIVHEPEGRDSHRHRLTPPGRPARPRDPVGEGPPPRSVGPRPGRGPGHEFAICFGGKFTTARTCRPTRSGFAYQGWTAAEDFLVPRGRSHLEPVRRVPRLGKSWTSSTSRLGHPPS